MGPQTLKPGPPHGSHLSSEQMAASKPGKALASTLPDDVFKNLEEAGSYGFVLRAEG